MLDRVIQQALKPVLNRLARTLVRAGVGADALSFIGFALGMAAALSIVFQHFTAGLVLLLLSRLMDGLDGAGARAPTPTHPPAGPPNPHPNQF